MRFEIIQKLDSSSDSVPMQPSNFLQMQRIKIMELSLNAAEFRSTTIYNHDSLQIYCFLRQI